METIKVTVSSHYEFTLKNKLDPEEWEDYGITSVTRLPNGEFEVVGPEDKVESFVDDFCIGDDESVEEIMDTAEYL